MKPWPKPGDVVPFQRFEPQAPDIGCLENPHVRTLSGVVGWDWPLFDNPLLPEIHGKRTPTAVGSSGVAAVFE